MKRRDFMKISVGGAVAMSGLNAKENKAGERVEKPKAPFANPSKEAAANAAKNPFGLVYGGAISKNEAGKVNLTPISYKSRGLDIAANVYTPANFDPNKSYAAAVVAHPNGGVKEQVAGLYAQRLAELGYVAIAFDAAYQGASEGMPRNVDTPANRIEDIRAAADFLLKFKGVDRDRIGVLGICGGGGYTLKAAQTDKIFKVVATLSAFDSGLARRNGFLDAQISTIQQRLKDASDARAKEVLTGEVEYVPDPKFNRRGDSQNHQRSLPRGAKILPSHARAFKLHLRLHQKQSARSHELRRCEQYGSNQSAAFDDGRLQL